MTEREGALQQLAHRYADFARQVKDAERKVSKAQCELGDLRSTLKTLNGEMKDFVGNNIRRQAVIVPGGIVVTVEYVDAVIPAIRVYENGREIEI
jgi:hypothetical protein